MSKLTGICVCVGVCEQRASEGKQTTRAERSTEVTHHRSHSPSRHWNIKTQATVEPPCLLIPHASALHTRRCLVQTWFGALLTRATVLCHSHCRRVGMPLLAREGLALLSGSERRSDGRLARLVREGRDWLGRYGRSEQRGRHRDRDAECVLDNVARQHEGL